MKGAIELRMFIDFADLQIVYSVALYEKESGELEGGAAAVVNTRPF